MTKKHFFERPAISLLPFLFIYILVVLLNNSDELFGDEGRYLQFANNLLHGFYSPPPPAINLWNGPGFPIYLMPFVALGLPLLFIKICNALLYFGTLLLFNDTVRKFTDARKAFFASVVLGFYYMPLKSLPHILSEIFTLFIISLVTWLTVVHFAPGRNSKNNGITILLSFLLAYLALTKVIFGYVFLFAAIAFLLLSLFKKNLHYRKSFLLMVLALLFCAPYLIYTYSLSGKPFYWSTAGGMSLYWMSNPVPEEPGEWYNQSFASTSMSPESQAKLRANHEKDFKEIYKYSGSERDDQFKKYAIRNIKEHPGKFFINWLSNLSRMLFNYPVSYTPFRLSTAGNMLANIPVLLLLFYSCFLTVKNRFNIPFALKFLLIISGIYLMGSSVLSAYDRMFYILTPITGLWIAYSMILLRPATNSKNQNNNSQAPS